MRRGPVNLTFVFIFVFVFVFVSVFLVVFVFVFVSVFVLIFVFVFVFEIEQEVPGMQSSQANGGCSPKCQQRVEVILPCGLLTPAFLLPTISEQAGLGKISQADKKYFLR